MDVAGSPLAPAGRPAVQTVRPTQRLSAREQSHRSGGRLGAVDGERQAAFPTLPCAYLLQLNVYKRPIVDCDPVDSDPQQNVSFQTFTVQVCPTNPS